MPKTKKAQKLAEAARSRSQSRARGRFKESVTAPKGYKPTGFSLYTRHRNFVDQVTHALQAHGMPTSIPRSWPKKANKSFVVQQALELLEDELGAMTTPSEYVRYFLEKQAKRKAEA